MTDLVTVLDDSAVVAFVKETLWIYPTMLTLHAIGLAFAVGVSVAIDLRVLGVAPLLPLPPLRRVLPVFYAAFALNAISGVMLVLNNPARWLVDPVFYVKLTAIVCAALSLQVIRRRVLYAEPMVHAPGAVRWIAGGSLVLWALAISTGRLLAYGFFR